MVWRKLIFGTLDGNVLVSVSNAGCNTFEPSRHLVKVMPVISASALPELRSFATIRPDRTSIFPPELQSTSLPRLHRQRTGTASVPNASTFDKPVAASCPAKGHGHFCVLAIELLFSGCHATPKTTYSTELPSQHTVNSKHFVIHSNVKLDSDNVLVQELRNCANACLSPLCDFRNSEIPSTCICSATKRHIGIT